MADPPLAVLAVGPAGVVRTVGPGVVCPADVADTAGDRAAYAALLFDAPLNLTDQVGIAGGANHVAVGHQLGVCLAVVGRPAAVLGQLGAIDASHLVVRTMDVILDHRLAQEQLLQLLERSYGKLLILAIQLVIAQHRLESKDLFFCQRRQGKSVDFF